jgi:uncharacterized protein involved in exopolysaccharide biosynthesis
MPRFEEDYAVNRITWADLASLLKRYRAVILITFVAVILGAYATLQFMTEQYEAQSSLLVKLGRENIELPTTVQQTGIVPMGMRPEELNSEIQILHSRILIEQVVDELGPKAFAFAPLPPHGLIATVKYYARLVVRWGKQRYNDLLISLNLKKRLTDREAAITLLDKAIEAAPEKGSDVISVTVKLPSAPLAVQVEQTLLARYFELRTRLRHTPVEQEFFRQQLAEQSDKLTQLEAQRAAILSTYRLSSVTEERALLLKQLSDLETQVNNDRGSDARLAQEQSVMRGRLPILTDTTPASSEQSLNPLVRAYMDRLSELQVERVKLAGKYQPGAEPLKRVEDEIASIEENLKSESPTLLGSVINKPNPVKQQFVQSTETNDVTLAGLRAEQHEIRIPMQQTNSRLQTLNDGEQKLTDVDRELKLAEDSYLDIARRNREATLHAELDESQMANVSLISPPSEPIEPIAPKKLLIMAVSIPVGLLLGIVLALLLHYMDDTIHDERDLVAVEGVEFLGHFNDPAELDDFAVRLTNKNSK